MRTSGRDPVNLYRLPFPHPGPNAWLQSPDAIHSADSIQPPDRSDPRPPCPLPCHLTNTYIVPALITDAGGDQAGWRYVEFFTANINNDHTRRAYARACSRFFAWCENRGLSLTVIRPFDVAAWVKELQQTHGAPGVKQQLAAVRMLLDWLITGQIVPMNPAAAVRGPKHVVKTA